MKVEFTRVNTSYACQELGGALVSAIPAVTKAAMEYVSREDTRKLVVVLTCPCCAGDPLLRERNTVLVSPFRGISCEGRKIHRMAKYPPYRTPGVDDEAATLEEYLADFKSTVEKALLAPAPG
jgi:hypothetical protein